jgi:hypothetical protein
MNGIATKLYSIPINTAVVEQSRFGERLDNRESNRSMTEHLLKLFNETFIYGNRSTIKGQKIEVVHELETVSQEDAYSNTEEYGSSVKSTDENVESNNHFPGNKCARCLNNTSGIRNGSDDNYKKCCDAMQSGKNTSDSVINETYTAANQTAQDSSPKNGSTSANQDGHISSSLDNKSTSTLLSKEKKELDVTNSSNLLSQSPSLSKDLNATWYVIPVIMILIVLVFVFAILFYKKHSKFWKWTPRDVIEEQMDIELTDMHKI